MYGRDVDYSHRAAAASGSRPRAVSDEDEEVPKRVSDDIVIDFSYSCVPVGTQTRLPISIRHMVFSRDEI